MSFIGVGFYSRSRMPFLSSTEITGPVNAEVEQFWHPGEETVELSANTFRIGKRMVLATTAEARIESGWRSRAYGQKEASPVIAGVSPTNSAAPVRATLGARSSMFQAKTSSSALAKSPGMLHD